MISVIVPVYNAEKYLHRCIDSILAQTYSDFELLLIDDGSKDSSGKICDEYAQKDSRVRVFHKENGGVSSARNLGLDNAKGEWVAFCDADDYVSEEWLASYNEGIDRNVDLITQNFYVIKDGAMTTRGKVEIQYGNSIQDKRQLITFLKTQYSFAYLWVKLFRRELLEKFQVRFDLLSTLREDGQFIAKYLEYANTFFWVDKMNYYYIYPFEGKTYGGDSCYTLLQIYKSFDVIYNYELPYDICEIDYVYVKDGASQYIASRKSLDSYHIDLYRRMVETLGYTCGLKNILRNFLIINNQRLGMLSSLVIRLLRCI